MPDTFIGTYRYTSKFRIHLHVHVTGTRLKFLFGGNFTRFKPRMTDIAKKMLVFEKCVKIAVLHSHVRKFYRTPAGYTADRKTRRKRNMGCYGLLSASCHPSPPPLTYHPPPTPSICRTACGHVIRIRWLRESPPPTHSP